MTIFHFKGILTLGTCIRKAIECFKGCLMSQAIRSLGDSGAACDLNYGCMAEVVLEEINASMSYFVVL